MNLQQYTYQSFIIDKNWPFKCIRFLIQLRSIFISRALKRNFITWSVYTISLGIIWLITSVTYHVHSQSITDPINNSFGNMKLEQQIAKGFDKEVHTLVLQDDGKLLAGGSFTEYNGVPVGRLARLNEDGSLDASFKSGTGFNNFVSTLALQEDGKIVVGGNFTNFDGTSCRYIVRLLTDGKLDASFDSGTGFNRNVNFITLQPNGKILVGGNFTSFNGITQRYLTRLHKEGILDTTFNSGTNINGGIESIEFQKDGKLLIGGRFKQISGTVPSGIARLNNDGTIDSTFTTSQGFRGSVNTLITLQNGKILAGGNFRAYNNVPVGKIALLEVDGVLDTTFNSVSGFNGEVNTILVHQNGKILVGGSFTTFDGAPQKGIAQLNLDGTPDFTFNIGNGFEGINVSVTKILQQPDGKVLAGGNFRSLNGVPREGLARLHQDGTHDTYFNTETGFNGAVNSLVVQDDGKTLVGGQFTTFNGKITKGIARLNPNGSIDPSFEIGTGFNGSVNSILLLGNGKVIIGGNFTSYNGINCGRIARLNKDGTFDISFDIGTGFNSNVSTIVLQRDGKILVGGNFTTYNNTFIGSIARLDMDGKLDTSLKLTKLIRGGSITSLLLQEDDKILVGGTRTALFGKIERYNPNGVFDTTFVAGIGHFTSKVSFNGDVTSLVLQPEGKVLVSGDFTLYDGRPLQGVARLNRDGTLDTTFVTGSVLNGGHVNSITLQSDGQILAGVEYQEFNGPGTGKVVRLFSNGSIDTTFHTNSKFNGKVNTLALQSDDKVLVGGDFTFFNESARGRIARLETDGTLDISLEPGAGFNGEVIALALQPDGKILAGGNFTDFNNISSGRIIRLTANLTLDTTLQTGSGFNGQVNALTLQPDGKLLAGGDFTTFNGEALGRIVRLNTNGILDSTFKIRSGFNGAVEALTLQADGKIVAGGDFTAFNDVVSGRIVRINTDGSFDKSFKPCNGFNGGPVSTLKLQEDGKILVGGYFNTFDGKAHGGITRLNSDGSLDTTFITGSGYNGNVTAFALQPDGKILVGGNFTHYNGASSNKITRINIDGELDSTFNSGTTFNGLVTSIALQSNGQIIVGGNFTQVNGTVQNRITRLNSNGTLDNSFKKMSGFNDIVNVFALQTDEKLIVGGKFLTFNDLPKSRIALLNIDNSCPPPPLAETQLFCSDITVDDLVADGTNIKWYTVPNGGNSLPKNNRVSSGTYYVSQTKNGCESGRTGIKVILNEPPTLSEISGMPNEPVQKNSVVSVSAKLDSGKAVKVIWDWGDGSLPTVIYPKFPATTLPAGAISSNHTYNKAGIFTITVTAQNACSQINTSSSHQVMVYGVNSSTSGMKGIEQFKKSVSNIISTSKESFYCYPTYFSESLTIGFSLLQEDDYVLDIYSTKGVLVRRLISGKVEPYKNYEIKVDSDGLAEGLYIIRLTTKTSVKSIKTVHRK